MCFVRYDSSPFHDPIPPGDLRLPHRSPFCAQAGNFLRRCLRWGLRQFFLEAALLGNAGRERGFRGAWEGF